MASLVKRGKKYYIVYLYTTPQGEKKQRWESFQTLREARIRKKEVEYQKESKTLVVPDCRTMNELLDEYIELHGKTHWAMSTYDRNVGTINN